MVFKLGAALEIDLDRSQPSLKCAWFQVAFSSCNARHDSATVTRAEEADESETCCSAFVHERARVGSPHVPEQRDEPNTAR